MLQKTSKRRFWFASNDVLNKDREAHFGVTSCRHRAQVCRITNKGDAAGANLAVCCL